MNQAIPNRLLRTAACLLFVASLTAVGSAQALQLEGGRILLGRVEQADVDGLRVKRLDTGGALDLRWDHLTPECARRIQTAHGLVSDDEEEVMVQADVVSYTTQQGANLEMIGRIVDRRPDALVIEKRGGQVEISLSLNTITNTRRTQVPASQIYTDEQFYAMLLAEHSPGDDPDKHAKLGSELSKARNYTRAEEHLLRAEELGGGNHKSKLPAMIERVRVLQRAEAERELLDQIRTRRLRGSRDDFAKGEELIAQFEERHAESPLRPEFEREKKRFEQAQRRYLVDQVVAMWSRLVRTTALGWVSANDEASIGLVRQYAESQMGRDIATAAAEKLDLSVEEVENLFEQRNELDRTRMGSHFFYGLGSWVLGEQAILKGTDQGAEQIASVSPSEDRELERLARKLRQARERAASATRGGADGEEADTPDSWWRKAETSEQIAFLRAYYAEFGGDFEVVRASVRPCDNCAGTGHKEVLGADGQRGQVECFLCRGTRFTRSVVAK